MQHQVGVGVEEEEGGHLAHPLVDVAVEQQPAVRLQGGGEQQVEVGQVPGEEQAPGERPHPHPAVALVGALGVVRPAGVVELRDGGLDRHPVRPRLPVVQLRAGHGDLAPRGDVLHQQGGQAFRGDLVDRADHHPVAVGELQAPVDPGLGVRGEALRGQLPAGDHHLAVLPVHDVAVEVGVQEVVVAADALDLVVGGQQGLVVPQADVAQGGLVGLHLLPGDGLGHGEGRLLHLVQPVGPPGGLDVTFDVGALQVQLVRRHPQPLHQGGVDHRAPHPDQAEDPQQAGGDPGPPHHRPGQEGQRP